MASGGGHGPRLLRRHAAVECVCALRVDRQPLVHSLGFQPPLWVVLLEVKTAPHQLGIVGRPRWGVVCTQKTVARRREKNSRLNPKEDCAVEQGFRPCLTAPNPKHCGEGSVMFL